jgi:hypothetical protein
MLSAPAVGDPGDDVESKVDDVHEQPV